jgi:hypothetical protein
MAKLSKEILEEIRTNPDMYAIVAKTCGLLPASVTAAIKANGSAINRYDVVMALAEYLGKQPEDLFEKEPEPADKVTPEVA